MRPARILVRAPSWIGDAVMATPALRALRAAQPSAEIAVEGPAALGELLAGLASFDRFLVDPGRGPRALPAPRRLRLGGSCSPTRRAPRSRPGSHASRSASATRASRCAARC